MRYIFFSLALLLLSLPAQAQELKKMGGNGLSYTTLGARKERTGGHMNYKVLDYNHLQNKDAFRPLEDDKKEKPSLDEEEAAKVWDKYKALADGTYKEEEKRQQEPKNKTAAEEDQKPAGGGIASILQEYQKNKSQRSQMRVIHVAPPDEKKETNDADKKENSTE